MINLKYAEENQQFLDIKERMKDLSLAFSHSQNTIQEHIVLEENEVQIKGYENIWKYLDQLEEELKSWYYCAC